MSKMSHNLDAPAFGSEAEKINQQPATETATAEASLAESGEKDSEQSSSSDTKEVVEQQVPYSRMKAMLERARVAEENAEEARQRLAELESRREEREERGSVPYEDAIKQRIIKLYGDNDTSREIIAIELDRQREIEEIAERKANEAYERRQGSEERAIIENERTIDKKLEDFQYTIGRDLTKAEEEALLTIADEYTPTDEDGRYVGGQPISFDKAWNIYQLQQDAQGKSSKKAREGATIATSARSQGEATNSSEQADADWKPNSWSKWRSRKI